MLLFLKKGVKSANVSCMIYNRLFPWCLFCKLKEGHQTDPLKYHPEIELCAYRPLSSNTSNVSVGHNCIPTAATAVMSTPKNVTERETQVALRCVHSLSQLGVPARQG